MPDQSGGRRLYVLLRTGMLLAAGFLSSVTSASEIVYLRKGQTFCDLTGEVCLRGTISYRVNLRLLKLRSRVVTAPGPGLLRIYVTGENRQGQLHRAAIEVTIRGHASEIVNKEMIPDAPDVYEWHLESILFDAKDPGSNEAR
ncbi:MAG TPA: hypothetical protein VGA68_02205 [Woeseiaceae bacterium]|jgi:hypothetical protein